jgi:hypothetical protein
MGFGLGDLVRAHDVLDHFDRAASRLVSKDQGLIFEHHANQFQRHSQFIHQQGILYGQWINACVGRHIALLV